MEADYDPCQTSLEVLGKQEFRFISRNTFLSQEIILNGIIKFAGTEQIESSLRFSWNLSEIQTLYI